MEINPQLRGASDEKATANWYLSADGQIYILEAITILQDVMEAPEALPSVVVNREEI